MVVHGCTDVSHSFWNPSEEVNWCAGVVRPLSVFFLICKSGNVDPSDLSISCPSLVLTPAEIHVYLCSDASPFSPVFLFLLSAHASCIDDHVHPVLITRSYIAGL